MLTIVKRLPDVEDYLLEPSLALYLPLYRLDGAVFGSRDAYGHACTVTGALWTPQGRLFDGIGNFISVADNAVLRPVNAITLEAWINLVSFANYEGIIARRHGTYNYRHPYGMFLKSTGALGARIGVTNSREITGTTILSLATWTQVAMTYSKTDKLRLYINGVADTVTGDPVGDGTLDYDLTYVPELGRAWNAAYCHLDSKIALARIYGDVNLGALQIASHYQQERGLFGR